MLIIEILVLLSCAIIAAITYRAGGSGDYPRWLRPVGNGIATVISMMTMGYLHWSLVLCFAANFSLTTYFGFINPLFKLSKQDKHWFNWTLVGLLSFSTTILPWCIFNGHWNGFFIRMITCTILTPLWSCLIGKDTIEEMGRGFINVGTLPLLLIA